MRQKIVKGQAIVDVADDDLDVGTQRAQNPLMIMNVFVPRAVPGGDDTQSGRFRH